MPTAYEKLSSLLKELFQLDQADLDFGIYRIMNQKRDEITGFLDKELLPQVKTAFEQYHPADKQVFEDRLQQANQAAVAAGFDPEQSPKVKELREQLANYSVDTGALENEVYSHLYSFFRRYYDNGDFISMRRYKEGVYAIPYEGEEVKLHWANADQYYIKTTENFRDYTFKLPSGRQVHFKLVDADTEKDNVKAVNDNERRFILGEDFSREVQEETPRIEEGLVNFSDLSGKVKYDSREEREETPRIEEALVSFRDLSGKEKYYSHEEHEEARREEQGLILRFEYRPDGEKRDQKAINKQTLETILANAPAHWAGELKTLSPTESNPGRTLLEKRLTDYAAPFQINELSKLCLVSDGRGIKPIIGESYK